MFTLLCSSYITAASEGPTPPLTGTQPPIEDGVTVRCPCSYNEVRTV